jgi:hypothetical protein
VSSLYVGVLSRFGSTTYEYDQGVTVLPEVKAIAGTEIDTSFNHTFVFSQISIKVLSAHLQERHPQFPPRHEAHRSAIRRDNVSQGIVRTRQPAQR